MSEEKKDHFISPISLDYNYTAGAATTRFLKKVSEVKLLVRNAQNVQQYMYLHEEVVLDVVWQLRRKLN